MDSRQKIYSSSVKRGRFYWEDAVLKILLPSGIVKNVTTNGIIYNEFQAVSFII